MRKVKIGIIGCGAISGMYLDNFRTRYEILEPVAVADMFVEKAKETALFYNIPKALSVEELVADPDVEIVLNLTNPVAHKEINIAALESGKHVYCEKPFALNIEDAKEVIALAKEKSLMLGCAPDTFLGSAWQTARKLLDDGWIGTPLSVNGSWCSRGHENWHPNPVVSYQPGAGPLFDNGVYMISQMIALLGPVEKVTCFAKKSFEKRTVFSQPNRGQVFDVNVNTHYANILQLNNNITATLTASFETWFTFMPYFEVHGTEGSMRVMSSCDFYNGEVKLIRGDQILDDIDGQPTHVAATRYMGTDIGYELSKGMYIPFHNSGVEKENMRALGLNDMAYALVEGRMHRVNSDLALHCLETMLNLEKSNAESKVIKMETTCERPEAIPVGGLIK